MITVDDGKEICLVCWFQYGVVTEAEYICQEDEPLPYGMCKKHYKPKMEKCRKIT